MSQVYFENVEPGYELPALVREPTREELDAFTKVWGSGIGRFTSDDAAQAEGFSGVILPGNMTMAFLAQFLTEWAGPAGKLIRLDVDFRRSRQMERAGPSWMSTSRPRREKGPFKARPRWYCPAMDRPCSINPSAQGPLQPRSLCLGVL